MNTNNDLISREALKKAIEESQPCCDAWIGIIDNAPTVDLSAKWAEAHSTGYDVGYNKAKGEFERPQGEWIKDIQGDTICKNCGFECLYNEEGMYSLGRYCHHCGADMRKGGV